MRTHSFLYIQSLIDDPKYDYKKEAKLVINRLKETAVNVTKKAIIELMDNKISVGALIQLSHWAVFNPTYEQNVIFETGNRIAEYQGVLISWREKIKYNLIRPTTIIQSGKYTDDYITTYGGPFQGIQTIKTQDFQPYIRVMPHAEYPSASGCICRMVYDYVDEYMQNEYFAPSLPVIFFLLGGSSTIEPGNGAENISFTYQNMQNLYEDCAESRLWGGMHFTAAIKASDTLCSNIGQDIYQYIQKLLNGGQASTKKTSVSSSNKANNVSEMRKYFDSFVDVYNEQRLVLQKDVSGDIESNDHKEPVLIVVTVILSIVICILFVFIIFDKKRQRKVSLKEKTPLMFALKDIKAKAPNQEKECLAY